MPESEIRILIARWLGLSANNDFALLEAMGGECAGAVSLLPAGTTIPASGSYKKLTEKELNELIATMPQRPLLAGEENIRLSLAGVQNKLPVLFKGAMVSLPMGNAASSHIMKPPIQYYPHTVENEYFCMQLAHKIGLNVPDSHILYLSKPLYFVERYDRKYDQYGVIIRLPQEDFCQAMSIRPDNKYEKEGGPSLKACFDLIRQYSIQPAKDLPELLDWVIFNYIIGNADAHGKNISLLLTKNGSVLAPFYDLMSTNIYPNLTQKMAMKIGGEDRPDWVVERRWQQFADDVGIKFKLVRKKCLDISKNLSSVADSFASEFLSEHGENDQIKQIVALIEQRKRKLNTIFNEVQ